MKSQENTKVTQYRINTLGNMYVGLSLEQQSDCKVRNVVVVTGSDQCVSSTSVSTTIEKNCNIKVVDELVSIFTETFTYLQYTF